MVSEELERLKHEYESLKKYHDTLKDYRRKSMASEKSLNESRGFTSVEFKEKCLKEKEFYDKAYNDLLQECQSRYKIRTSALGITFRMGELKDSIQKLEARE